MATPIEQYAFLSDSRSGALVSARGSIDWLCLPRYDSASVFAALLGDASDGCWGLRPLDPRATATRRYDGETFILVTRWETERGVAEVHEFMPVGRKHRALVRRTVGITGAVEFVSEMRLRFDYARALPWVRQVGTDDDPVLQAVAGPDAVHVRGPRMYAEDTSHRATWAVRPGDIIDSVLWWAPSHVETPAALDVDRALSRTRRWWSTWSEKTHHSGPRAELVTRSLLVLRALTNADTGGIVAAATTSLPEQFGGSRNWDYRYVWLRDAALSLQAFLDHGDHKTARHWRGWLLRAIAGDPADVQIMYGIAGERDLPERELPNLPGYDGAAPVRIGNGAVDQYQADVIGEVMVALQAARDTGVDETRFSWALQRSLLGQVIAWMDRPDNGIWEIRGEPQMFTHSRVMMWAAFDRGVRGVEEGGLDGDVDLWRRMRAQMRAEIDEKGVDPAGHFVQHYGSDDVDASLLVLPRVGYCAPDDPRMLATVARIESDLMPDGFVRRYRTQTGVDGLAGDEHPFLACSFWLVEQYAASGRREDAESLMDRVCAAANDLGLLSEEFDPATGRQAGNTPQALSHLALVGAADALRS